MSYRVASLAGQDIAQAERSQLFLLVAAHRVNQLDFAGCIVALFVLAFPIDKR